MRKVMWLVLVAAGCTPGQIDSGSELISKGQYDGVVHAIRPSGQSSPDERSIALTAGAPHTIFVNRRGGTYQGGQDDSAHGVSSVVGFQGLSSATVGGVSWSDAQWQQFYACIADEYARFQVTVTDQRPATGPYVEGVIGGTGAELGYGQGIGGVAPVDTYNCQPISSAVVYIFANNPWAHDPQVACEIAAQELGHAIVPMDHEYLASDPMTYLSSNAHKTFQDVDAQCGEYQPRQCFCNRATQNSVRLLTSTLGPRASNPPPTNPPPTNPPPTNPPPTNPPPTNPPPTNPGDTTPPTVTIQSPDDGASLPGNGPISVAVQASDDVGVTDVQLFWAFTGNYLPCNNTSFQGVSCTQAGGVSTWTFNVGTGDRQFYATASDAAGNRASSATRTIHLTSNAPPPPVAAPPDVRVDGPAAGTTLTAGGPLTIQATVHAQGMVTEVIANWTTASGATYTFPMHEITSGVFALQTTVSPSAPSGPRSFTVTATDDRGSSTTSPRVGVVVQ